MSVSQDYISSSLQINISKWQTQIAFLLKKDMAKAGSPLSIVQVLRFSFIPNRGNCGGGRSNSKGSSSSSSSSSNSSSSSSKQ